MAKMFPDSGVPASDALNSLPDVNTIAGCAELWYSTSRCQPRFDPAAANAMLAELMNLINKGEVAYDCTKLDNIERAVRYLIQRGLPVGGSLAVGPNDYTLSLDPTLTRYNNYLTLIIVPNVNNQGAMRINVDGKGLVPVLRNDGQQVQAGDFLANRPALISYWNGTFYSVGLLASQVPLRGVGAIDAWVRVDGNDFTGDGTSNDPSHAFRTINGAYNAIGSRYTQTPGFQINFKLGIPGDYEAFDIGNGINAMSIIGLDGQSPGSYRITSYTYPSGDAAAGIVADC